MTEVMEGMSSDPTVRTIRMVSDMIEYRTREIAVISISIRKAIRQFHREVSTKKHDEQAKYLRSMTEDLQRLVADNNFDIKNLEVYLQRPVKRPCMAHPAEEQDSSASLHYFQ